MENHEIKEEKISFTGKAKKRLITVAIIGFVFALIGIGIEMSSSHAPADGHGEGHASVENHDTTLQNAVLTEDVKDAKVQNVQEHGEDNAHADAGAHGEGDGEDHGGSHYSWINKVFSNLWINSVFWLGLGLIGAFFVAIQYVAQAGWSAPLIRVPMAMASWLPIGGLVLLAVFLAAMPSHALFHWLDPRLTDVNDPHFDSIIAGKSAFLNVPFYLGRMIVFIAVWILLFRKIKANSLAEDIQGTDSYWRKNVKFSAIFIVFFGYSTSIAAWDWVMSIDPHWFSTMFGWYVFASWWVAGLASVTLIIVYLKEAGYLKIVTNDHLHDLGKFVWAFSIFWTYIWFSQFLLIYYSNIPEETIYFIERLRGDNYAPIFFLNLIINFLFPFLLLMTRDAKRRMTFLKIVCTVIIFGHWMDFFLMITPANIKEHGSIGFMEIGSFLFFGSLFLFVTLNSLSKINLVAVKHPMLEESLHHHS